MGDDARAANRGGWFPAGWLIGIFRDVSVDEIYDGRASIVLSFTGVVAGKRHYIRRTVPDRGIHIPWGLQGSLVQ